MLSLTSSTRQERRVALIGILFRTLSVGLRPNIISASILLLNDTEERDLSKRNNVKLWSLTGMTTRDTVDHESLVARKKPDMIAISCRANCITNNIDAFISLNEIASIIIDITPKPRIMLSGAIIRRDQQCMDKNSPKDDKTPLFL